METVGAAPEEPNLRGKNHLRVGNLKNLKFFWTRLIGKTASPLSLVHVTLKPHKKKCCFKISQLGDNRKARAQRWSVDPVVPEGVERSPCGDGQR